MYFFCINRNVVWEFQAAFPCRTWWLLRRRVRRLIHRRTISLCAILGCTAIYAQKKRENTCCPTVSHVWMHQCYSPISRSTIYTNYKYSLKVRCYKNYIYGYMYFFCINRNVVWEFQAAFPCRTWWLLRRRVRRLIHRRTISLCAILGCTAIYAQKKRENTCCPTVSHVWMHQCYSPISRSTIYTHIHWKSGAIKNYIYGYMYFFLHQQECGVGVSSCLPLQDVVASEAPGASADPPKDDIAVCHLRVHCNICSKKKGKHVLSHSLACLDASVLLTHLSKYYIYKLQIFIESLVL